MSDEKRKFRRSDCFLIVEFKPSEGSADYSTGITDDCSKDGFSFESQGSDLKQGETLKLKLKHPYRDVSVSVSGEIVWVRGGWYKYAAGIRFTGMNKETERRLLELIAVKGEKAEDSSFVKKDAETVSGKEEGAAPAPESGVGQVNSVISGALENKYDNAHAAIKDRSKKVPVYMYVMAVIAVSCAAVMLMMFEDPVGVGNIPVYTYTEPVYDKNVDERHPAVISEKMGGDDLNPEELSRSGQTQAAMEESGKLPRGQEKPGLKQVVEKPALNPDTGAINKKLVFDAAEVKNLAAKKAVKPARQKERPEKIDGLPPKKKGALSAESVQGGNDYAMTEKKQRKALFGSDLTESTAARKLPEPGRPQTELQKEDIPQEGLHKPEPEDMSYKPQALQSDKEKAPGTSSDRQDRDMPRIALILTDPLSSKLDGDAAPGGDKDKKSEKWKIIGKTRNGTSVYINSDSISSRSGNIIKAPVITARNNGKSLIVLEMDCLKAMYRVIDKSSGESPVPSTGSHAWQSISNGSIPKLVYNAVCSEKE